MKTYEKKLKDYIIKNNIDAKQYIFENTCHSVEEAAIATNACKEDFVKNICMIDVNGNLIVAIVKGEHRVSTKRVSKVLNIQVPRIASTEEILQKTGYICGGVPSFGFDAIYLIDPKVMDREYVYTGGGSPYSLTKISTKILKEINNGEIVRVRK